MLRGGEPYFEIKTHINSKVEISFKAAYQKSRSNYEFFSVISLLQVTVFEGLQRSDL